jgi:hypothetical protein
MSSVYVITKPNSVTGVNYKKIKAIPVTGCGSL